MNLPLVLALLAIGAFLAVALLTRALLPWLRRRVVDQPNARSSHSVPTPRGGGVAIVAVALPLWALAVGLGLAPVETLVPVGVAVVLALVHFLDDLRGLPAGTRFVVQLAAVVAGLAVVPGAGTLFGGLLPRALDLAACGFLWLWFVNLYNFMDGIDGIAGVETACLGVGIALVASLAATPAGAPTLGLVLAAAALGFLVWNWHPAKLFMGDVGSIPLGYLLGWLLLGLGAQGRAELTAAALILPLYYLSDASWTLGRRLLRGEKFWQAHRQHFYQRAARGGLGHVGVVRRVLVANLALIGLAVLAPEVGPLVAVVLAALVVALLLGELARRAA